MSKNDLILFDGGFGTYYEQLTPFYLRNLPPELAVKNDAQTVLQIHRSYLAAGANAIKTDTFGTNLGLTESMEDCKALICAGYELAFIAAAEYGARVYADIGPIGRNADADAALMTPAEQYAWIADIFLSCGANAFLFETMSELTPLFDAIALIRQKKPQATVIISFAVSQDGYTQTGEYYKQLLQRAQKVADYVGLNCQCGPVHMEKLLAGLDLRSLNCIAMPNAGYPALENGRTVFRSDPAYFAQKTASFASRGVKGVGGCCGTTPEHIAALIEQLGEHRPDSAAKQDAAEMVHLRTTYPLVSRFGKPVAVEIPSPVDTDAAFMLEAAHRLKDAGADYITIPDSPLGKAKADSIMMAAKIVREVGIPTIAHMTCRDKNQLAVKGQLLAASMENLHELLVITGDPVQPSLRQNVKQVFSFTSFGLISYLAALNEEVFSAHPFTICAALNTSAANFEKECERAQKKIENGAQYLFTQPVYNEEGIARIKTAKGLLSVPIFVGIMPVAGYKNALFLNNEVAGIDIPDTLLADLKDTSPEQAKAVSVGYAAQLIDALYDTADGFYLMTPLKKVDFTLELVRHIRSRNLDELQKG